MRCVEAESQKYAVIKSNSEKRDATLAMKQFWPLRDKKKNFREFYSLKIKSGFIRMGFLLPI